jgi:tape measure domain-containing protein
MAGKNRVGSLYMELVLDPSKYAKGASQAVKDHRRMQKELSKAHNGLDPRAKAAADLDLAKKAAVRMVKLNKMTFEQGKAIVKAATANYKAEIKKIDKATFESHEKQLHSLKEKNDKELADIRKAVKEEDRIRDRAIADDRARAKERQAHARRRRTQRLAAERAEAAKIAAIRRGSFAQGVFGAGSTMQSLGAVTGAIGKVTQALFPLAIAGYAASKAIGSIGSAFFAMVRAADEKKKSMLVLTTLMEGNEVAAGKLRQSLVDYAVKTSFAVEETMQLAIQMKALGFAAEEIPSTLAKLGRLSFGDGNKLKLIAKAFADVKAQGKLLMTEVRQFANAGVPLLAQLSLNLGKSALEVRDLMKAGAVGFEDVSKAVDDIAESYGAVDEAGMMTWAGQMDALGEEWTQLLAKWGEGGAMKDIGEYLRSWVAYIDQIAGNWEVVKGTLKGFEFWIRSILAIFTLGLSEIFIWTSRLVDWLSGAKALREEETAQLEKQAALEQEKVKRKREELEIATKLAHMAAAQDQHSIDTMTTEQRFTRMRLEAQAQLDENAKAQLDVLDAQEEREKKNREAKKRYDDEMNAVLEERRKAGGTDSDSYKSWEKGLRAEYQARYILEMELQDEIERAKAEKDLNDVRMKEAEDFAKAEAEAAEKLQKQKEEWKKQGIKDAKELIRLAKAAQTDFEKKQDEANKFKDMAPQTSPSFQANSIAEFTFRKEKELQRDRQREENKREAARREHAEQLNINLIDAIRNLGLNENDQDLGFEGIE